jgi:hypothetical protein
VIAEILGLKQLLLPCIFQHVEQGANNIAHQLEKRALKREEWVVMRNDIPVDLRSLVIAETAGEAGFPNRCNPNFNH